MRSKVRASICIVSVLSLFLAVGAQDTTIRSMAQNRFSFIEWFIPLDVNIHVVPQTRTLAGGNESFPVLSAPKNETRPAIYPSAGTIGVLDYSGINQDIIIFARAFSEHIIAATIPQISCTPDRLFISTVLGVRLAEYPKISQVFFGRPVISDKDHVLIRYRFLSGEESDSEKVLNIAITKRNESWLVEDFWFGGL